MTGCGEKLPIGMPRLYPASVTIMQEGTPLAGAVVQLIPEDSANAQWGPGGMTDASGVAELRTNGPYKGAPLGTYKVVVSRSESDPHPHPELTAPGASREDLGKYMAIGMRLKVYTYVESKYGSVETTPLRVEITAKGKNYTIDAGKPIKVQIPRAN